MPKCFYTGIEIPLEQCYVLDRGAAQRALIGLKQRSAALERVIAQLTPRDQGPVFDVKTHNTTVRANRRLVSRTVAEALSAACPEARIFLSWPDFKKAGLKFQQQQVKARKAAAPSPAAKLDECPGVSVMPPADEPDQEVPHGNPQ